MRPLRYSINVTLDGCCDHRAFVPDEELFRHGVENFGRADALLLGRVTYEMMEAAWRGPAMRNFSTSTLGDRGMTSPNPRLQRALLRAPLSRQPLVSPGRVVAFICIGFVLLVGVGGVGYGSDAMSAAEARRELLERDFKIVTTTQEVPEPVRVLLAALTKTEGQVLAEPNGTYQETDVVTERGLPRRRLIFAGNGKGVYVLNYELGERGHSQHVAVFEFVPGRIALVWRAVLDKRVDNLKDLREAVRKGQYRDAPSFAF